MKATRFISAILAVTMAAGIFTACGEKNTDDAEQNAIDEINNMSEEELEAAIYSAAAAMENSAAETTTEAQDEVQTIDIWKDIDVTFSGIENRSIAMTHLYTGDDEILSNILNDEQLKIYVNYPDSDDKYTNGTIVTLQISNDMIDKITAAGYELESDTSPEITISGLAKPLTAFSELSEEEQQELFDHMDEKANETLISFGYGVGGKQWSEEYNLSGIEIIPIKRMICEYEGITEADVFSFYMVHVTGTKTSEGIDYPLDEYKYAGSTYLSNIGAVDGKLYVEDDYVFSNIFVHTKNVGNDWYEEACEDIDGWSGAEVYDGIDQTDWLVDTTLGSETE